MRNFTSLKASLILLGLLIKLTECLKHHIILHNDHRSHSIISSFGYLRYGLLEVEVHNMTFVPEFNAIDGEESNPPFGLSLFKPRPTSPFKYGSTDPYLDHKIRNKNMCFLTDPQEYMKEDLITMIVDTNRLIVKVRCWSDVGRAIPQLNKIDLEYIRLRNLPKRQADNMVPSNEAELTPSPPPETRQGIERSQQCSPDIPLIFKKDPVTNIKRYSFGFTMRLNETWEEGLYYLTFHNCPGKMEFYRRSVNATIQIEERNYPHNYLSAGDIPLPQVYFILSVMFFLSGCIWINFISRQRESVLKIHNLMSVLVFTKSFSLLLHGINYHFIAVYGQQVVTWAYLYYITRSIKGALFFITLVLIGTGWSFVKHILSDKDKKIIIIVVCLQVIAHTGEVILDETSEGDKSKEFWFSLCSLVDLFSCIAILVPIGWSVSHLREASRTDGKALINLKKLQLFNKFFIITTIYIYVSRIAFVPLSLLSHQNTWLSELFMELTTLTYFIITGYCFQPIPTNPYLLLSTENDLEEDILFSMEAYDPTRIADSDLKDRLNTDQDELLNGEPLVKSQKVTRRTMEDIA